MTPRLFTPHDLKTGAAVPLDEGQAHYLRSVLRREVGADLLLFNGRDGEFAATLGELKKRSALAILGEQSRAQHDGAALTLIFAPVKRGPLETIIQKATEIGVAHFQPVITARTVASKIKIDRLEAIATEAAEQSGRLSVPSVSAPIKFQKLIEGWAAQHPLMFCDEAGDDESAEWGGATGRARPVLEALKDVDSIAKPWAILTGPEGGFTPEERDALRAMPSVTPVTLGPLILRADTAVITALALWQAALGDWRQS